MQTNDSYYIELLVFDKNTLIYITVQTNKLWFVWNVTYKLFLYKSYLHSQVTDCSRKRLEDSFFNNYYIEL